MSFIDIFRKKKEVKEPERNPYWNCDRVILNKNIEHLFNKEMKDKVQK